MKEFDYINISVSASKLIPVYSVGFDAINQAYQQLVGTTVNQVRLFEHVLC